MHYFLHQLKRRVLRFTGVLGDVALFIGVVLLGGLVSGWYMIETGSALTTHRVGPWRAWTSAGRVDADPYTRAHFARAGSLPLTTEIASTYIARADSSGNKLYGSCGYTVEGRELAASWWSLTAFDDRGRLITNELRRHAYTSDTVALRADGSFTITLGRDVEAGNWLPTSGGGRLTLVLNLIEPRTSVEDWTIADDIKLPSIQREGCG